MNHSGSNEDGDEEGETDEDERDEYETDEDETDDKEMHEEDDDKENGMVEDAEVDYDEGAVEEENECEDDDDENGFEDYIEEESAVDNDEIEEEEVPLAGVWEFDQQDPWEDNDSEIANDTFNIGTFTPSEEDIAQYPPMRVFYPEPETPSQVHPGLRTSEDPVFFDPARVEDPEDQFAHYGLDTWF